MPGPVVRTKEQEALHKILEVATNVTRENLVGELNRIVNESTDPLTPVLAMGAVCYGRANTDENLTEQEVAALKSMAEMARTRAAKEPGTPEAQVAEGAATLFTMVAEQTTGTRRPVAEHRKMVVEACTQIERAERGSNQPIFDVLSAASKRFSPGQTAGAQSQG